MPLSDTARSAAAIHRKLRALTAVFRDPASTAAEKANAETLKARLEQQLAQEGAAQAATQAGPEAKWTDIMFRLGRGVKEMKSGPSPQGDWTVHAFRLGRMFRRGGKS